MIILNTVSPKHIITGAGANKKALKMEMNRMAPQRNAIGTPFGGGNYNLQNRMNSLNLGEKRKPIKFL
jgi:hypothetical protein